MTYAEFCEKFTACATDAAQSGLVKRVIKKDHYMPFAEKTQRAEVIINSTCRESKKDANGNVVYGRVHINSSARYIYETMSIIACYTEIEVPFAEIIAAYDAISKCGALGVILSLIDDSEKILFHEIVDWTLSDLMTNEYETKTYIERNLNVIADAIRVGLPEVIKEIDFKEVAKSLRKKK